MRPASATWHERGRVAAGVARLVGAPPRSGRSRVLDSLAGPDDDAAARASASRAPSERTQPVGRGRARRARRRRRLTGLAHRPADDPRPASVVPRIAARDSVARSARRRARRADRDPLDQRRPRAHAGDLRRAAEWVVARIRSRRRHRCDRGAERAPARDRHVPAPTRAPRRPTVLVLRPPRRPAPGSARALGIRPLRRSPSGTAGSSRAASPTTRHTCSCSSRRPSCCRQRASCPSPCASRSDAEEEIGGHSVVDWVERGRWSGRRGARARRRHTRRETLPAFCTALRGICYFHVTVRTGERDLHSGMFGGAALTATHALVEALSAVLPGADGRLPESLRAGIVAADRRRGRRLGRVAGRPDELARDRRPPVGRQGRGRVPSFARKSGALGRPSTASHGGSPPLQKTVLPVEAHANVSIRLAPGQSTGRHRTGLRAPPARRDAAGRDARRRPLVDRRARLRRSRAPPAVQVAQEAFEQVLGVRPLLVRSGGSIPRCGGAGRARRPSDRHGVHPAPSSQLHSPNENIPAPALRDGLETTVELLRRFGSLLGETRYASPLAEELAEEVLARFLRHDVVIDTQSDPTSTTYPLTEKQLDLSQTSPRGYLRAARARGRRADRARPTSSRRCRGRSPARRRSVSSRTSTRRRAVSGTGVRPPLVHRGWEGAPLRLPGDPGQVLDPDDMPGLADRVGHDLVTSDGTTLLGADDKAGRRDHRHRGRASP